MHEILLQLIKKKKKKNLDSEIKGLGGAKIISFLRRGRLREDGRVMARVLRGR